MQDIMDVLKALADETRLRALCALRNGELCVCQLIALLDLSPSTVSKHLSILRQFRTRAVGKVLGLLFADLDPTTRIRDDRKQLKKICNESMETLCRRLFCKP
ncbi:MAG: metalloregulator ArsR/SmtB family transcription factor [Kiritimatiellaeota bacterium]|nr:metalloregulator ArsR/SmtB family transcription factor [Kiritimatiellota bacterium]